MWVEIVCGFVVYQLFKRFFYSGDDVLDVETSDANALFLVANRVEKLFGGKAYTGLRIPDVDTGTRQNIDIVLVTKGEAVVISVKNFSGFASIDRDGSWACEGTSSHKTERHPDPVVEAKNKIAVLESYLEQRGVALPEGYLSYKVIIPNPKFRVIHSNYFPPEVITYDDWSQLKPEPKGLFSGLIKGALRGGKKEMQESISQKLEYVLGTAPSWDRLELKGNKCLLGEFLEFKGKEEDVLALRAIKRSKINRLVVQKTSMLGFAPSRLQVLCSSRDYRSDGASASEWKELHVRSSTEILFQPQNSPKVKKFKLSSTVSLTLSG
ncbi:unnamed protein product [Rhodiola kirilowii]